jgi:hypothetical protein
MALSRIVGCRSSFSRIVGALLRRWDTSTSHRSEETIDRRPMFALPREY